MREGAAGARGTGVPMPDACRPRQCDGLFTSRLVPGFQLLRKLPANTSAGPDFTLISLKSIEFDSQ